MTTPTDPCPHGMPSPGSCLDCMEEGLLPPPPKPEQEHANSHARLADAELIAAAPQLIAELCDALDTATDPDLAARLLNMSKNGYDPDAHEVLRAAARIIGGNT